MQIQQNQYVQPVTKAVRLPKCLWTKSMYECFVVSESSSSPSALAMKNTMTPTMMYESKIDGPAREIALPEPRKSPVPMTPPIDIN
jgi:hypothetical protein